MFVKVIASHSSVVFFDTVYKRNEQIDYAQGSIWMRHRLQKMLVSIYNVSRTSWPTFRDLWPRNGWDPFAHCDPPFGSHYVATII